MKRLLVPFVLGMAALYLALAVGAAGCLRPQLEQTNLPHHHHPSHVAHSAFCAWACQANPTVSALVETPPAVVFQLITLLILVRTSMALRVTARMAHSRAPPAF